MLAFAAGAAACDPGVLPYEDKPTTLVMELLPAYRTGCPGDGPPLEFEEDLDFSVQALDALGRPFPYSGPVAYRMAPGRLDNPWTRYSMSQGRLSSGPVSVSLAHGGRAHVWAELVGEGGRSATGVSPDLCFRTPRIEDIQRSDSSHSSDFDGQQVAFRGDRLVATATDSKGFYVTDLDSTEYSSVYAFTFGEPTGVKPGSCFCEVSGGVKEFLHFTEIVFPTWRVYKPGGREAAAEELEEERLRLGDDEVPDPRDDESIIFTECSGRDDLDPLIWDEHIAKCSVADPFERERLTVPPPVLLNPADLPDVGVVPWDDKMKALDKHEASLVAIGPVHLPDRFENCDLNRDGEVDRCFNSMCPALNSQPRQSVIDSVCNDAQPIGGCQCTCSELKESNCTESCARTPGCAERAAYEEFGQWGVTVGDGDRRMNLLTRDGLPDFIPVEDPRRTIHCVVGSLKQVAAAPIPWVIAPRRASDVLFDPPSRIEDDPCAER